MVVLDVVSFRVRKGMRLHLNPAARLPFSGGIRVDEPAMHDSLSAALAPFGVRAVGPMQFSDGSRSFDLREVQPADIDRIRAAAEMLS